MNINRDPLGEKGNPDKVYREEFNDEGTTFTDTPAESDARDQAKIEKARSGQSQKMDGADMDEFDDGDLADEVRRETLENK